MEIIKALPHWIIFVLWASWFLEYWIVSYLLKGHATTVQLSKSFQNIMLLGLLGVVLLTLLFTIIGMTIFNLYPSYLAPSWLAWTGVIIASLGLAGLYWSRISMGPLWLPETGLKREHRVISNGIYGIVRHPIYTFTLIFYLGSIVVFPVWWNWLALPLALIGYVYKALEEETFLVVHLPGYSEYQHQVRFRLIPGVW